MSAAGMHDMTQGSLRGHLVRIAAFICVSMLLQIFYSLVDLYWVGHLGSEAIAAVALGSALSFLALAGTQTLAIGTVALIAPAAGRKDFSAVTGGAAQATSISLAGGVLFLVAGLAGTPAFAHALAADTLTAQLTIDYLVWFIPSMALQFVLAVQGSALRALGNMKLAMATQMGSLLLNFALAPVLVLGWPVGPRLGVAGAGLATFIATVVGTVFLSATLARTVGPLRFPLARLKPEFAVWRRILVTGLPAGGEFLLMTGYLLLVNSLAGRFGADAQAGFGAGMRWLQAFFIPALSLSFAAAAVAGQNFGAQRADRVRGTFRETLTLAMALMLTAMVLLQIAPAWLMSRLTTAPGVIATGSEFLRIISWNLLGSAVIFACSGLFQGLGNTVPALIASATRIVLLFSLALWAAGQPGFQLHQIWQLSVATTLLQAALCAVFLRYEFRRKLEATAPAPAPEGSAVLKTS